MGLSRLAFLALAVHRSHGELEAYIGAAGPRSPHYSVTLQQDGTVPVSPHVYLSESPDVDLKKIHAGKFCSLHGGWFCNRTVSWVDFGHGESDVTHVAVTLARCALSPHTVRILPSRAGIVPQVDQHSGTVRFDVRGGKPQHLALEWGERSGTSAGDSGACSSFAQALYIFAGGLDPAVPTSVELRTGGAIMFGPGLHHLGMLVPHCDEAGVLQLPPTVSTVHVARGAWVEGRINITTHGVDGAQRTLPLRVVGHGIFSGARYKWHGGTAADSLRMIELAWAVPLHLEGPTLSDSKGHTLIMPPGSTASELRIIGWLFNEDGIWLTSNSTLTDSFVRTNDDSIRLYAGAVDHFDKTPLPPKDGRPASGITVDSVVVHQLFNGAVLQVGWEDYGTSGAVLRRVDVIGAEWFWAKGKNSTAGDNGNNAVLSLQGPQYDVSMVEHHSNLTLEDVRLDAQQVGRVLAIELHGAAPVGCSSVSNLTLRNISMPHALQWYATDVNALPSPGENLLCAQGCDRVAGVWIDGLTTGGKRVLLDADWKLERVGNVTMVHYV